MTPTDHRRLNIVAAMGLAVGAALGMAGTIVTQANLQNTCWAIDSVGSIGSAIGGVQVQVDGITVGNATYGIPRSDV